MTDEKGNGRSIGGAVTGVLDHIRESQVWTSVFRPGSLEHVLADVRQHLGASGRACVHEGSDR